MKRFNALVASGAFLATATVAMAPAGAVVSGWADPASGTIAPVTIRTIEEDRWTPAGSGFQEVASTQRDLTFTMGGQVLQHLGGG
ncbi:MAG: hypothetical protein ACXVAG_15445 [Vulcanimicrobiaceae bacterium]